MKSLVTALCLSVLLAGCNGQNPFKRQSDPLKNYPNANGKNSVPYTGDPKPEVEAPVTPDSEFCRELPMSVEISNDEGGLLTYFREGVAGEITITVTNRTRKEYDIEYTSSRGGDFKVVGKDLDRTVLKFTWSPEKSTKAVNDNLITLTHKLKDKGLRAACHDGTEFVSVVAVKNFSRLEITKKNVPEAVVFGGEAVDFQILVDDPESTQAKPPVLSELFYNRQADAIDATKNGVADCEIDKPVQIESTTWAFNCRFNPAAFDEKSLVGSGREKPSVFYVTAKSSVSALKSSNYPVYVKVTFPKVEGN